MTKLIKTMIAGMAAAVMLTGCAGNAARTRADGSSVTLTDISVSVQYPESWSVFTGDKVYDEIYSSYTDTYSDAKSMREGVEGSGLEYLVYGYSPDRLSMVTISVQDMTADSFGTDSLTAAEYARTVHDSTVISYQASDYKIGNGSFSDASYGGYDGWLSCFDLLTPDEEPQFIFGQAVFIFPDGNDIYKVQVLWSQDEQSAEALSVLDSMKAE